MSLFIGNIAGEISLKELEELFTKYGKCEIKHKKIYAFVEYSSDKEAEQAKQDLNNKEVKGRILSIEWSKKSKNYIYKRNKDSIYIRCYICGHRGHLARDCSERKGYRRYHERRYRSRSRSRSRHYRSRRSHNSRDYSSRNKNNSNSGSRDNNYKRRSRSRKRSKDSYYRDKERDKRYRIKRKKRKL